MAADLALCAPTDWITLRRIRARRAAAASASIRPMPTTCTSIALFTPPTSVVPRRASAISSPPLPGLR